MILDSYLSFSSLFYPLIFYVDDHQQEKREEISKQKKKERREIREGDIGADLRIDPLNERKKHNSGSKVRFVTDRFVILWA